MANLRNVYEAFEPQRLNSLLVFDTPHSGRMYPKDFDYDCDFHLLRRSEDLLMDKVVENKSKTNETAIVTFEVRNLGIRDATNIVFAC